MQTGFWFYGGESNQIAIEWDCKGNWRMNGAVSTWQATSSRQNQFG
jgi:hypothetical protein